MTTDSRPLLQRDSLSRREATRQLKSARTTTFRPSQPSSGLVTRKVQYNNTGSRLAALYNDRQIYVWAAEKADSKATEIRGAHERIVEDISWNPLHEDELVSGSLDKTVKVWDTRSKKCLRQKTMDSEVLVVSYSTDGRHIAIGLRNDTIVIVNARLDVVTTYKETDELYDLAWSNGSDLVAVTLGSGNVKLLSFDDSQLKEIHTLRGHRTASTCVAFDPRGYFVAVGSNDGIVSLWETNNWICTQTVSTVDQPVSGVSFSHDGLLLAVAYDGAPVSVAWAVTGEVLHSLTQKMNERTSVHWHPLRFDLALTSSQGPSVVRL